MAKKVVYNNYMLAGENIITVSGLTKKFKDTTAVNNISLTVKKGSIFAFLGTNGAGKSTTINMLTTTLSPTSGVAQISGHTLGKDDSKIRQLIGVVFQQSLLDPLLTVRENLRLRTSFYRLQNSDSRIEELAIAIGLADFIDRRYGKLSGGQRRRADIARALLHSPELLFLDEPTTGLDPKSREDVWKAIMDLQTKTGLTVFLTTHYMEEAERADDIHIINKGDIIAHDSPQVLRAKYTTDTLKLITKKDAALIRELSALKIPAATIKGVLTVSVKSAHEALKLLKKYETDILDFEFRHGSMDDVFLYLTDKPESMESEKL